MSSTDVRVTYMESLAPPPRTPARAGRERVACERLARDVYLDLYRRVGAPLRWDQRLRMPADALDRLLSSTHSRVYVLRDEDDAALGFCEFDRSGAPDVELKNFGLIPDAQGRGLGPWLLACSLQEEWRAHPQRIWLHTDTWDHPAAIRTYERAGFRIYDARTEPAGPL